MSKIALEGLNSILNIENKFKNFHGFTVKAVQFKVTAVYREKLNFEPYKNGPGLSSSYFLLGPTIFLCTRVFI